MRTVTTTWFTVVLTAAAGLIVALQIGGLLAQSRADGAWRTRVQFAQDLERIRYYDELLTMSARMAAATGDLTYRERYDRAVPELDTVLRHALKLADADARTAITQTDEANVALVKLERDSFDTLAAGDREGAYALLTSERYETLKLEYSGGLNRGLQLIDRTVQEESRRANNLQVGALAAGAVVALMLAVFLMVTTRRLRASQRARSHVEEQLRRQAQQDPLTGLANRRLFRDQLSAAMEASRRVAVLCADLDGFKMVNDTYGHAAGDSVLIEVAERIQDLLHAVPGGLAARLGGDEFALLLPAEDRQRAEDFAARLVDGLARPYTGGRGLPITASVGVAYATTTCRDPGDLLREADLAMYDAKVNGRNRWRHTGRRVTAPPIVTTVTRT
jgi:diguanylate cyclase (GGDEF)-like protein